MSLREDGAFSPDVPATVGDFLGGLYPLIGGGAADADACKEMLVQYQLVSADLDLNGELKEGFLCDLLNAIGAAISTDDAEAAVPRADLADLFFSLGGQ